MDAADGGLHPVLGCSELDKRSQNLLPSMNLNSSTHILFNRTIRTGQPLSGPDSFDFLMSRAEKTADTVNDWWLTELSLTC